MLSITNTWENIAPDYRESGLVRRPKEDSHATIPRLRRLKALYPLQLELVVGSLDP